MFNSVIVQHRCCVVLTIHGHTSRPRQSASDGPLARSSVGFLCKGGRQMDMFSVALLFQRGGRLQVSDFKLHRCMINPDATAATANGCRSATQSVAPFALRIFLHVSPRRQQPSALLTKALCAHACSARSREMTREVSSNAPLRPGDALGRGPLCKISCTFVNSWKDMQGCIPDAVVSHTRCWCNSEGIIAKAPFGQT
jgi:hypothetical protein